MPKPPADSIAKGFVKVMLTGGINAKADSHQLENGTLKTADNVIFGAIEGQVTKRYGCTAITPQGAPLQGGPFKAIGLRDNIEPLILGANILNKYNIAQNLSTAIPTPTQGRIDVSQVGGSTGQTNQPYPPTDASMATDGLQFACVTWQEPNTTGALMFYGVQDLASGAWIIPPTAIANKYPTFVYATGPNTSTTLTYFAQMSPKVVYTNGNFYISFIWTGTSNGTSTAGTDPYQAVIAFYSLPISNLAGGLKTVTYSQRITGATTSTATTSPSPLSYDFHVSNDKFILGEINQSNLGMINVQAGTISAGQLTVTTSNSLTVPYSKLSRIAVKCDGPAANPFAIANANYLYYGATLATLTGTAVTVPQVGTPLPYPVDCMWAANGDVVWLGYTTSNIGAAVTATWVDPRTKVATRIYFNGPINTYYIQILSRAFFIDQNGKVYVWVGAAAPSSDTVYNSAYLVEFDFALGTALVVCRTLYLKNSHINGGSQTFPTEVVRLPASNKYVTHISSALEKTANGMAYGALNRVQFDFTPSRAPQILPLPTGGNMICSAYPLYYDGNSITEAGFSSPPSADPMLNVSPELGYVPPTVTFQQFGLAGGPSAITLSGNTEYYYVICLVRRDAYGNVYRSAPSPVITVPCPFVAQSVSFQPYFYNNGGNVQIEYYRSTQGTPGSFYFIGQVANGQPYYDIKPDGSTSAAQNNSITKNRLVYTNSNELPNDPPPPIHHAALSENRMYIIPSDARNTVWASKIFSPGRTVEFNAGLTISEGQNSGLYTAVQVMDNNVIVFKADSIVYFYGDGPDNGGSGNFSQIKRIASDVGCIDPASLAIIPGGLLFRSRRGIELLNRSLQVQYVGAPIEPILKNIGDFASTVVVPRFTQVRFVPLAAGQPTLVFDYGANRWSTFSNMAAVNARNILGGYWWISQDGTKVYQETPDRYLDDGMPILMTIETPEIPVGAGGVQGWGRAYRMALLGDFYTDHKLKVEFAYDHQTTYTDSVVYDTKTGLIAGDAVYQFRCSRLPRSVMQTLRIKITDSGTVGQSCAISSIALEVGSKNGLAKLAAQKTI